MVIYMQHLQRYSFSLRAAAAALAIWAGIFLLVAALWKKVMMRLFSRLEPWMRYLIVLASLGCGILAIPSQRPILIPLLPVHSLEVRILQEDPSQPIVVEGFYNGIVYASVDALVHGDEWKREGDTLTASSREASFSWSGHTGGSTWLIFQPSSAHRDIDLYWDGRHEVVRTSGQETEPIFIYHNITFPKTVHTFSTLVYSLGYAGLFFFAILVTGCIPAAGRVKERRLKWGWLAFAVPPALAWTIYLLTFFPALMTKDSFYSWDQLLNHAYQDLHPVSYTMYLWLLTRAWFSPAAVALFQVACLSLVIAATLGYMLRHGLPAWTAWVVSAGYAALPINGVLVISIWKDIPYSIAMLWLFAISMRIVLEGAGWLEKRGNLVLLGTLCAAASLMRHNGLVVSIGLAALLFTLYPAQRKRLLWSAAAFLLLWGAVKGPVYRLLKVKTFAISSDQVMIFHIGAHIYAGTPMTQEEIAYLDAIQPYPDWWQYSSCSINNILANGQFDADYYGAHRWEGWKLFFYLLGRNPWVNLDHIIQSGSYLVRLEKSGCTPKVAFLRKDDTGYLWMSPDNSQHENSQLPSLLPWLYQAYERTVGIDLLVMPAFYLYIIIVLILGFALRSADTRWLFLLAVPVIQSAVMYMANVSNEFRFQYAIVLISILCLALPFWDPGKSITEDKR